MRMQTPSSTPALHFPAELLLRARPVRVVFFDVDGVFTDGGIEVGVDARQARAVEVHKRFHTLDGHGVKMLQRIGITPVVITGRDSPPLRARMQELGVSHAHYAVADKKAIAEQVLQTLGLSWQQAAAMGDDWPDLPLLRRAALACAPANAHAEVLAAAHCVTEHAGGNGAVRELCDLLLMASGRYAVMLQDATQ